MLRSHPHRASSPEMVFGDVDGIMIHLKFEDVNDLQSVLKEIISFVPDTRIPIARPYRARLTTQNRESLKNSIKFAIFTYIITFFTALAITYKYPPTPKPEVLDFYSVLFNAALTSIPPTVVVYFSKKIERLGELWKQE